MTQEVLVILSGIDPMNVSEIKEGIDSYQRAVARRTNGEFRVNVTYHSLSRRWTTQRGGQYVFPYPDELREEAHKVELFLKRDFHAVTLIYDDEQVIGERPTNPYASPGLYEGLAVNSIPLNWIRDGDTKWAAKFFFAHENCHTWFQRVNELGKLGLHDRTHDKNTYDNCPMWSDPDQTDFFADILLELRPHWRLIAQGKQKEPMLIVHKKSDPKTKWMLASDMKVGFADFTAYQLYTAGRDVVELALDDAEFDKIPTSQALMKH